VHARSYLLADGNGLAPRVQPNGTKTWLLRYRRPGTRKENFLSLGPYPDITLVDARRSATTARNLVREGTDPVEHRRAESTARKRVAEGAFHLVAQRRLDLKRKEWAGETYRKAEFVVREYLTPALRNKPISTLATPEANPHSKRSPPTRRSSHGAVAVVPWDEVNLKTAEWHVAAERMEMRHDHVVPLPKQAIAVLKELQSLAGSGHYVFPSPARQKTPHLSKVSTR
jgi:uncharacterized protein YlaI